MRMGRLRAADQWVLAADDGGGWRAIIGAKATDISDLLRLHDGAPALELGDIVCSATLGSPITRPGKIIAIGLNYLDHIRETGATRPDRPVVFAKFSSSVIGPYDDIVIEPDLTSQGDYEAELAVVIGRPARRVSEANALQHVFGYLVANDVSARDWQKPDGQLSRSKSMDTFCPLGPWITAADQVPNPSALAIRSWVNGESRQDSSTAEMVFSISQLISFLSQTMTLEPGDVILTGTPHGVGFARNPPVFLAEGDVVRCEVEGLGYIENKVARPKAS
ncbi:MAG: fumarylacetoacetate hydrolase family protein [Chloroflexi bacterium]|nr:fumarylacetoacetate hydrolase family protein [Chloroflexota bacterium]